MKVFAVALLSIFGFAACGEEEIDYADQVSDRWNEASKSDRDLICDGWVIVNDSNNFKMMLMEGEDALSEDVASATVNLLEEEC